MHKLNFYLFKLTSKYILINLIIISIFIMFLNLIEISRILQNDEKNIITFLSLSFLKFPKILNEILPFVTIIAISFLLSSLYSIHGKFTKRFKTFHQYPFAPFLSIGIFCSWILDKI